MRRTIWTAVLVAVTSIGLLGAAARAEDVPASQDNPPGCATATAEADDGCGAQGRDHFANAGHQPPIEACAGQRSAAGSTITRIVPAGPRRTNGALAFTSGACVYLPPGYVGGEMRYSVLYLLHGGGGDQADWVTFGSMQRILDDAYETDPNHALIVVMPDGRSGQYHDYYDDRFLIETYLLRHLVPAVDEQFRTIADRSGRAIAGLSNGGYGALHMAAKAPDLFTVAGSMSGNLGARTFSNLGPDGEVYYQGNVPYQLASNLDPVDLVIDIGALCISDAAVDACATFAFEQAFRPDNLAFRNQLDAVGYKGTVDYRETEGGHSWRWWTTWLRTRDLPFFYERLSPPVSGEVAASPLPATFRYRSISPRFSVWGYEVAVTRDVSEFLDLTEVGAAGFTVQGSGRAEVTTAARYRANNVYRVAVDGGTPADVVADPHGRLTIDVDLGPSHTQDQFTEQADIAEKVGGYYAIRKVSIQGADSPAASPSFAAGGFGAANVTSTGAPKVDQSALPGLADTGGALVAPGAIDATTVRPAADSSPLTEPVRRVSIALTALMGGLAASGSGVWWKRRQWAQEKDA